MWSGPLILQMHTPSEARSYLRVPLRGRTRCVRKRARPRFFNGTEAPQGEQLVHGTKREASAMKVTAVGIELAKNGFQVH